MIKFDDSPLGCSSGIQRSNNFSNTLEAHSIAFQIQRKTMIQGGKDESLHRSSHNGSRSKNLSKVYRAGPGDSGRYLVRGGKITGE